MRSSRPDKARVGYNYVSTEIRPRYGGYGTRVMVTDGHGIYLFIYLFLFDDLRYDLCLEVPCVCGLLHCGQIKSNQIY